MPVEFKNAEFKEFQDKYPTLFPEDYPKRDFYLPYGWREPLHKLFAYMEKYATEHEMFHVNQVKEKFWGLRVYTTLPYDSPVTEHILEAERACNRMCIYCGADRVDTQPQEWGGFSQDPYCPEHSRFNLTSENS